MKGKLKITFKDNSVKYLDNTICNSFIFNTGNLVLYASNNNICDYPNDNAQTISPSISLVLTDTTQFDSSTAQLHFVATFSDPNLFEGYPGIGIADDTFKIGLTYIPLSNSLTNVSQIDYYIYIPAQHSLYYNNKKARIWANPNKQFKFINLFDNQSYPLFYKNIEFWNVLDTSHIIDYSLDLTALKLQSINTPSTNNDTNTLNGYIFWTDTTHNLTQKFWLLFDTIVPGSDAPPFLLFHPYYITDFVVTDYSLFSDLTTLTPEKSTQNPTLIFDLNFKIKEFKNPINNFSHLLFAMRMLSPYTEPTYPDYSMIPLYFVKPYIESLGNDNTKEIINTDIQLSQSPPTTIQKYYQNSNNYWTINSQFIKPHPLWNEVLIKNLNLKFATITEDGTFIVYNNNDYTFISDKSLNGTINGTIIGAWNKFIFSETDTNFNIYSLDYNSNTDQIDISTLLSTTKDYGSILDTSHTIISIQPIQNGNSYSVFVFNSNRQLWLLDTSSNTWSNTNYSLAPNTYPYFTNDSLMFYHSSDGINISSLVIYFNYYGEQVISLEHQLSTQYAPTVPPYLNSIRPNDGNQLFIFYNENDNVLYLLGTNYTQYDNYVNNGGALNYWIKEYSVSNKYVFYPVPTDTIPLLLVQENGVIDIFTPSFTLVYNNGAYEFYDGSLFWDTSPMINWNGDTPYPVLPTDDNTNIDFWNTQWLNNDIVFYKIVNLDSFIYKDVSNYFKLFLPNSLGNLGIQDFSNFTILSDTTIPSDSSKLTIYKIKFFKEETIDLGDGYTETVLTPLYYPIIYGKDYPTTISIPPNTFYVQTYPPFHIYYVDESGNISNDFTADLLGIYWITREDTGLIGSPFDIDSLIYDIDLSKIFIDTNGNGWSYSGSLTLNSGIITTPILPKNVNNAGIITVPILTKNVNNAGIITVPILNKNVNNAIIIVQ